MKEPLILVLAEVAKVKGMTPDVIWYLPTYVKYAKIMVHVRDHVQRLYGNCRTLQTLKFITSYE